MPASKTEQVLEAIKARLLTIPDAMVERNRALPEKVPDGGLIVLRDGDPGEPEQSLGGFGGIYYQHAVEIEVYVEEGDATVRDTVFDDLLQQIGAALDADPTFGGLAFGQAYGRPELSTEAVAGAPAIKSATLSVTVDYETDATSFLTPIYLGDPHGASLWFDRTSAHEARDRLWSSGHR